MKVRITRKNKKRKDPRYFLYEGLDLDPAKRGMPQAPEGEIPPEEPTLASQGDIQWADRNRWKQAKGELGQSSTAPTRDDITSLEGVLGAAYNILNPNNIEDVRRFTFSSDDAMLLPLGRIGEDLWVKVSGDEPTKEYGFVTLSRGSGGESGLSL